MVGGDGVIKMVWRIIAHNFKTTNDIIITYFKGDDTLTNFIDMMKREGFYQSSDGWWRWGN